MIQFPARSTVIRMDRKSLLVLVISFVIVMLWFPLFDHFFPPPAHPQTTRTNSIPSTASNAVTGNVASLRALGTNEQSQPASTSLENAVPETLLVVTNPGSHAIYTFTSRGAGMRLVELDGYAATVSCDNKATHPKEAFATLNSRAETASMALSAGNVLSGDADYSLSRLTNGVRAEKQFSNGLRITKDFEFGTNYQLTVHVRLENQSPNPLRLPEQELVVGTSSLMNFGDNALIMGFFWYNGSKAEHITQAYFDNRTLGCIPGTPRSQYLAGENNVVWAAVHNQFFALAAIPREPAPQIIARHVDLKWDPSEVPKDTATIPPATGLQTAFLYPALVLPPGKPVERQYTIYAGPKEYNTLARIGSEQKNSLDLIMDFGFFGFASKALLLSMNGLNALGLSYGLAIICITVIVKLLFWPLTHASTRSMKRMQAFQPQMKAIQEKYKDDPTKMNQKLMAFMKENKVSPLGGCLPMLLQIPVFMGFYRMLQSAIELRGASFLWACDLSQPDTVAHLSFLGNFPINPLPLFMGATQIWQARMTPPAPGADPAQQKMMQYMPLMIVVFMYKTSAGLALYWAVQNLLTIVQMKITKSNLPVGPSGLAVTSPPGRKKK